MTIVLIVATITAAVLVIVAATVVTAELLVAHRKSAANVDQAMQSRWGSTYRRLASRFGRRKAAQTLHEREVSQHSLHNLDPVGSTIRSPAGKD